MFCARDDLEAHEAKHGDAVYRYRYTYNIKVDDSQMLGLQLHLFSFAPDHSIIDFLQTTPHFQEYSLRCQQSSTDSPL
jgi:hypothetical protein